jgi:hypothetical protein
MPFPAMLHMTTVYPLLLHVLDLYISIVDSLSIEASLTNSLDSSIACFEELYRDSLDYYSIDEILL